MDDVVFKNGRWVFASAAVRARTHREKEERQLYPTGGGRNEPWAPHVEAQFSAPEPVRPGAYGEKADLYVKHEQPVPKLKARSKNPSADPTKWLSTKPKKRVQEALPFGYEDDQCVVTPLGVFPKLQTKKVSKKTTNGGDEDLAACVRDWDINDEF